MTDDRQSINSSTPLLGTRNKQGLSCHFGAVYKHDENGGTVTLNLPHRHHEHDHLLPERGRARTVSSLAPLPESCYTINTFLFFLTCFQLMNLLTLTYTDSVINYIAKRFHIPNTMASFIPSAYQIGSMIVIIPISYYGNNFNRPKAIAVGVMVMIVGLFFCVLPHFILPSPKIPNTTSSDLCSPMNATFGKEVESVKIHRDTMLTLPDNLPCNANGTVYNPALLLIIGHALFGAGSTPLWPLGVSYIDDHVVVRKMPIYLGIFIGTTLTGPVFGFLLGSVSSAIYVNLHGKQLKQSNPGYIGAWWLGYLIACVVLILLLFPFYFYPRYLPVSPQKQAELAEIEALETRRIMSRTQSMADDEAEREFERDAFVSQSETSSVAGCGGPNASNLCEKSSATAIIFSKIADMFCAMKRTLETPLVLTAISSYVFVAILLSGVATFGSSYAQMTFNLFRTTSDMLIGGVCVPLGIAGTLVGGFVMKKYNFDIRTSLRFVMAMGSISCIIASTLFACGCQTQKVAGVTMPYKGSTEKSLVSSCNSDCYCPKGQYELICGVDQTTYISPCYAGCQRETRVKENFFKEKIMYHNCSCVLNERQEAEKGPCSTKHCIAVLVVFIILAGLGVMFFICLCQAPIYVILLRMLESDDKALGIGLMSFLSRLLGYIPGPIWFGMILDRSCIYWSPKCQGKSTCLLYNTIGLRYSFIGLCFACTVAYVCVFAISFFWMEAHPDYYEKSLMPFQPADSSSSSDDNAQDENQDKEVSSTWK